MSWLQSVKRPIRDALRHRREAREQTQWLRAGWRGERQIEDAVTDGRTIVVGPWLTEVGYEALYWIPFLRWVKRAFRLDSSRVVAVSRGGVRSWYAGIADRYVEIWDEFDPGDYARWLDTQKIDNEKAVVMSEFDHRVIQAVERRLGCDVTVLDPSMMYRLFSLFWSGQRSLGFLDSHARFEKMQAPRAIDPRLLPAEYIAVKFYAARSLPDTPDIRRALTQYVQALARETPVVLLDTGLLIDNHVDYTFDTSSRIISAKPWMTPTNNLAVQTQVIAGAKAFVSTCGSLAWLAPMLGVNTTAVYTDPKWLHLHLGVMMRACAVAGAAQFTTCDPRALEPLLAQGSGLLVHES